MTYNRTATEYSLLRTEAERRVRAGEVRAAVGRALGVPYTTVSRWAASGRWLRKDLDAESREEVEAIVAARLAQMRERSAEDARLQPIWRRPVPQPASGREPGPELNEPIRRGEVLEYKSATGPGRDPALANPWTDLFPDPDSVTAERADRELDVAAMSEQPVSAWHGAFIAQTEAVHRYERGELDLAIKLARFSMQMYALQKASDAFDAEMKTRLEKEEAFRWQENRDAFRKEREEEEAESRAVA